MDKKDGILIIGDPHLSSRNPGFRKDNYSQVILDKVDFALQYSIEHKLLPVFLGDIFDCPRSNSNALITELVRLLSKIECCGIYGNHDVTRNSLEDDDSLRILIESGCYRLIDSDVNSFWSGFVGGTKCIIGGTSWGKQIPREFNPCAIFGDDYTDAKVIWITHHDLKFHSDTNKGLGLFEFKGVDAVFNGHIHMKMKEVRKGTTTWYNLGNISRIRRTDYNREKKPFVTVVRWNSNGLDLKEVKLPTASFDEVFYPGENYEYETLSISETVQKLSEQNYQTATGAGLDGMFSNDDFKKMDPAIQNDIINLKKEVVPDE